MKKIILGALLLVGAGTVSIAQTDKAAPATQQSKVKKHHGKKHHHAMHVKKATPAKTPKQ